MVTKLCATFPVSHSLMGDWAATLDDWGITPNTWLDGLKEARASGCQCAECVDGYAVWLERRQKKNNV